MSDIKWVEHDVIWLEPHEGAYPCDRQWCQDDVWGDEGVKYIRADLVAAKPAVAVKALKVLEWVPERYCQCARPGDMPVVYRIWQNGRGTYQLYIQYEQGSESVYGEDRGTEDEAKAFAQADYERRSAMHASENIPNTPTDLTYKCRMAIENGCPHQCDWSDKPLTIILDLCDEVERLTAERDGVRREALEDAAKVAVARAAQYDASFDQTTYKAETLAAIAALTTTAVAIRAMNGERG